MEKLAGKKIWLKLEKLAMEDNFSRIQLAQMKEIQNYPPSLINFSPKPQKSVTPNISIMFQSDKNDHAQTKLTIALEESPSLI